jgi:dTDP-4-dehydrorhamnose 3,5-epimerase
MLHGVIVQPLHQIIDERGKVMHMLRCNSPLFEQFGEIYFSVVNPGAVKAWKLHTKMTLNYAVPIGEIKLIMYDERLGSPTKHEIQEILLGEDNYCLIRIPPMIWTGFQGKGSTRALIANCATLPHDPNEVIRCEPCERKVPYDWDV